MHPQFGIDFTVVLSLPYLIQNAAAIQQSVGKSVNPTVVTTWMNSCYNIMWLFVISIRGII